jgi:hypothetical protein
MLKWDLRTLKYGHGAIMGMTGMKPDFWNFSDMLLAAWSTPHGTEQLCNEVLERTAVHDASSTHFNQ